jgi:hypothetical protein
MEIPADFAVMLAKAGPADIPTRVCALTEPDARRITNIAVVITDFIFDFIFN